MSENFLFRSGNMLLNNNSFKETVCIDAFRVYDSCADKDCIEDLRCYFVESAQHLIEQARNVKLKCVNVVNTALDIEHLPFQKGFYSIDLTFYFEVLLDVYTCASGSPVPTIGFCSFNKKVILYGSEGSVKIFSSDYIIDGPDSQEMPVRNLPRATVQVATPLGLSARICESKHHHTCDSLTYNIPPCICKHFGGDFVCGNITKTVLITLGLFTIVQLERNVQMLVPSYDFGIPEKECVSSNDNPCDLFSRIEFPTSEFFPPRVYDASAARNIANNSGCNETCSNSCAEKICEDKCKEKCKEKFMPTCGCREKHDHSRCGCKNI